MLAPVMSGVTVTPLLTVGDVLPSGFRFEAIPDGIAIRPRGLGVWGSGPGLIISGILEIGLLVGGIMVYYAWRKKK